MNIGGTLLQKTQEDKFEVNDNWGRNVTLGLAGINVQRVAPQEHLSWLVRHKGHQI